MTKTHSSPLALHVVSHTHWDREWYLPAGRFRQRLVALIDELLDGDEPRSPFLLDGQAVVPCQPLHVRPEGPRDSPAAPQAGTIQARARGGAPLDVFSP